jgi:hypothetical protein
MIAGLFAKDGAKYGEPLFHKTRMNVFRGCLEYSPQSKFNLCPKNGGSCFDLFLPFLYPLFGDLLYFVFLYNLVDIINNLNNILY